MTDPSIAAALAQPASTAEPWVTMTATPAVAPRLAMGGACSGTVACVVTMNSTQTVSATFNLLPTLQVTRPGHGQRNREQR